LSRKQLVFGRPYLCLLWICRLGRWRLADFL